MSKVGITWVTTDWHIGHDMMRSKCGRPADFSDRIIRHHREMIRDRDTTINLGDLLFYGDAIETVHDAIHRDSPTRIPGRHVLVLGNHDIKRKSFYYKLGFDFVCEALVLDGVLFTHHPARPPLGMLNVHGHWHLPRKEWPAKYDPGRQFLVSMEESKYRPVNAAKLVGRAIAGMQARGERDRPRLDAWAKTDLGEGEDDLKSGLEKLEEILETAEGGT